MPPGTKGETAPPAAPTPTRAIAAAEANRSSRTPARPRPAATLVLLREGETGPEILLLRRNPTTRFAPGAYVFPGGAVDAGDGNEALLRRWDGLSVQAAQVRLRTETGEEPTAIAYYAAAVREAFEETGLLVGGPAGLSNRSVRRARKCLLDGVRSFAEVLEDLDTRLDGRNLEYIAHWVTPVAAPRRYDTRFFAAEVPPAARAVPDEREMTGAVWLTPATALARHREGRLPMIFPTVRTLEALQALDSVSEIMAFYRNRPIPRTQPEVVRAADGVHLRIPSAGRVPDRPRKGEDRPRAP